MTTAFYLIALCLLVIIISSFGLYKGLKTNRPPMQKGLKGTSLTDSKPLLIFQLILLAIMLLASSFAIYFISTNF